MWWDARIDPQDRGAAFRYDVYPVVGTPANLQVLDAQAGVCDVVLPAHIEDGIGTWFNRAVVSSQAFARQVAALGLAPNAAPSAAQALKLRTWLANDMEQVFAEMLDPRRARVGRLSPDRHAVGAACVRSVRAPARRSVARDRL